MAVEKVCGEWANNVETEFVVACIVECSTYEHACDALSANGGWDFGVEQGDPAAVVGLELEVGDVGAFFVLESTAGDFGGSAHGIPQFPIIVAEAPILRPGIAEIAGSTEIGPEGSAGGAMEALLDR
jgi:hypothetical protein